MSNVIRTADYVGPDRRGDDRRADSKTVAELEKYIDDRFAEHEVKEQIWFSNIENTFAEAFPNGDLTGHHNFHQSRINAAKAEEEFWRAAKTEALKHGIGGLFGLLRWITVLALLGVAYKLGIGPVVAKLFSI